jgi:hypothetical protein
LFSIGAIWQATCTLLGAGNSKTKIRGCDENSDAWQIGDSDCGGNRSGSPDGGSGDASADYRGLPGRPEAGAGRERTSEKGLPATHSACKTGTTGGFDASGQLSERVSSFERAEVLKELVGHNHNITQTAKALGLERSHLYKK